MRKTLKIIIIMIVLSLLFMIAVVATSKETGYYAYGDSIVAEENTYVLQMVQTHDSSVPVDRNTDGGGKDSNWGVENLPAHFDKKYSVIFIAFGANDVDNRLGQNLITMYKAVKAGGSRPIIILPSIRVDADYYQQANRIMATERLLKSEGIPYVTMYDATDMVPHNGRVDLFNQTNNYDVVHPNYHGHALMAEYLWKAMHPYGVKWIWGV